MTYDDGKGSSSIMCGQISDILKHECLWAFGKQNTLDVKEKSALRLVVEPLFRPYYRKWLTRETCEKYIKRRYAVRRYFSDVPKWNFAKVGEVGFASVGVPFRREHAKPSSLLIGESNASNSRE